MSLSTAKTLTFGSLLAMLLYLKLQGRDNPLPRGEQGLLGHVVQQHGPIFFSTIISNPT